MDVYFASYVVVGMSLMIAMTWGGVGVYRRWPPGLPWRRLYSGLLVALPWTGLAWDTYMRAAEPELTIPLFLVTPGAWALWLAVYIAAHIYCAVDGPLVGTR